MRLIGKIAFLAMMLMPTGAWSQGQYPTVNGPFIPATVMHCLNAQGLAVPATSAGTCVGSGGGSITATATAAAPSYSEGAASALSLNLTGDLRTISKQSGTWTVTGPLTDAQLRASAVPVSAASLPLPSGAATEATLAALRTDVQSDVPNVTGPLNAAAAVATKSLITGCQYLSSLPTYTNTQQGGCTFDINGRLLASLASAAPIAPATGTATKSNLIGFQYNSTQATFTDGQQGGLQGSPRGAAYVVPGAEAFTVQPGNTQNTTPWLIVPAISTVTTGITRPADTNAYAANDNFANSTSAPTTGGFTFTSACRASGGSGKILDAVVSTSAGTVYQGELWIFDQAITAVNDNATFTVSDSDILNLVTVIPFMTSDVTAANSVSYVQNIEAGYTCVGTANLRYLVKIMSAVTPASAEVLTARLKVQN